MGNGVLPTSTKGRDNIRFKAEEMLNIIDSIFKPNDFDINSKRYLISKSDGIIYILLEYLKHLYFNEYFTWDEREIWLAKDFTEIESLLKGISFNEVLKMNLDECFAILDKKGLGDKGRDLLRYLYFKKIHAYILNKLLELDLQDLQYILDVFETNHIIKKQLDPERYLDTDMGSIQHLTLDLITLSDDIHNVAYIPSEAKYDRDSYIDMLLNEAPQMVIRTDYVYEFHHQLKAEYFAKNYLPISFISDYYIMVAKHYKKLNPYELFFDGTCLRDNFRHLSEPHLKEKLNFLLFKAYKYLCPGLSLN
jgi:hypothetical protein